MTAKDIKFGDSARQRTSKWRGRLGFLDPHQQL